MASWSTAARSSASVRPSRRSWRDRVGDRVVEDAVARGSLATAERTHPAVRLGQVDQREVEREGADDRLGGTEVQVAQVVVEPRPFVRVVVAAEGDGPPADPLDEGEQLGPGLLRDDLAEERTEQADLHGQRVAGAGRADAGRLGGDRRRRLPPGHGRTRAGPFRAPAATGPQPF